LGSLENEIGLPFAGRSGKLLDRMLEQCNVNIWKDIYVSNIVKCRPIEFETNKDRKPFFDEITRCDHFIKKELEELKPKLIITLGRTSSDWLQKHFNNNSYEINVFDSIYRWLPTYHPSYLLRTGLKDVPAFTAMLKDTIKELNIETNKAEL
jgi:uracil-DNA glycosylase